LSAFHPSAQLLHVKSLAKGSEYSELPEQTVKEFHTSGQKQSPTPTKEKSESEK